ncbi:hypothetical protein FHS56_000356 [Thermonema lapsum]|uniref:Uncharacterized protein n=1 Tax=Thermonema lapsum TaxID=28195 RepID=A0A846MN80_9BACT|nr:hypothetical protein [Thermonema lapsum]
MSRLFLSPMPVSTSSLERMLSFLFVNLNFYVTHDFYSE